MHDGLIAAASDDAGEQSTQNTQSAWVVFSGQTDRPWLKCLKRGYRHCFVIINDGRRWLSFDPMLNYTDIRMHHHIPPEFDLPSWFNARGHHVLSAPLCQRPQKPAPFALFTCVEAVKRILGLHARLIITPWQLYRYLSKHQTYCHSEGM